MDNIVHELNCRKKWFKNLNDFEITDIEFCKISEENYMIIVQDNKNNSYGIYCGYDPNSKSLDDIIKTISEYVSN